MATERSIDTLFDDVPPRTGPIDPSPWHNRAGNSIHLVVEDVLYYRDRIDGTLTVLRREVDDEVVGFELKGVKELLDRFGSFGVHVAAPPVHLFLMIASHLPTKDDAEERRMAAYLDLIVRYGDRTISDLQAA